MESLKMGIMRCTVPLWVLILSGCVPYVHLKDPLRDGPEDRLSKQATTLGQGLAFQDPQDSIPEGAVQPEAGARYMYDRSHSANSRQSPMGIEIWLYGKDGVVLHTVHKDTLKTIYSDIYGWDAEQWAKQLGNAQNAAEYLRTKSDFFWESLAQQFAERVFGEDITPALYRFGPHCLTAMTRCADPGIPDAQRLVIKTTIDGRRDPMNPVTRSIYYDVHRGDIEHPDLIFVLRIMKTSVAGPHRETLDYRPLVMKGDTAQKSEHFTVWAHLPRGQKVRTKNTDYPDYNLLLVPLRHLVMQGPVADPKSPAGGMIYPTPEALFKKTGDIIDRLRTPDGGRQIAQQVAPFLTPKYYYMFEENGQGLKSYRDYILGDIAGLGKGLNPDFGRIEVIYNRDTSRTF